jgi:uncharacterized phage-associated protein
MYTYLEVSNLASFSAYEISRWVLIRNNLNVQQHGEELITHLKLQKLLYYAQGVFLAFTNGKELFEEEILAWEHGPVVEEAWHEYKAFGKNGIEFEATTDDVEIHDRINADKDVANVLEMIFNEYGKYSAWHLRNKTHEERPWRVTKANHIISKKIIKEYFEEEVLTD